MVKLKAGKKVEKSPLTHIVVKSVKNTVCPLKMSPGHLAIQRGGNFLWDNLYIATASMTTTVKCMYGKTGDFVLSLLFAHTEQTQTNHTLCVRMWGLGVETGTRSYKHLGCTFCIINLRSLSSLQMPNHTISYAFCICTCIVYDTEDLAESSVSYTLCLKNDTDVAHYNFNAHQPILVIFGTDVAESVCYRMMICCPTSPN